LFEILAGRCLTFLIANQRVVARLSLMGKTSDKISVSLSEIATIEIRTSNGRHGNVFLKGRRVVKGCRNGFRGKSRLSFRPARPRNLGVAELRGGHDESLM
jgi:hypothetical protein